MLKRQSLGKRRQQIERIASTKHKKTGILPILPAIPYLAIMLSGVSDVKEAAWARRKPTKTRSNAARDTEPPRIANTISFAGDSIRRVLTQT